MSHRTLLLPLSALLLFVFQVQTVHAQARISELVVIHGGSSGITCPGGYTRIDADLNRDAGGEFIYLCYKRGVGTPISGLQVTLGSTSLPAPAWSKIDVDLNRGAGGDFIYLWYTKDPACTTVSDIAILFNSQAPAPGFQKIPVDLNKGADGDFIYIAFQSK